MDDKIKKIYIKDRKFVFFKDECVIAEYNSPGDIKNPNGRANALLFKNGFLKKANILMTTTCNCKCEYCYQKDDFWGNVYGTLSEESADKIINRLGEKYKKVECIRFFGGEPLINFEKIKTIVLKSKKRLGTESFEITTNGMLITDEIAKFFAKHNFDIILSLDGPAEINDTLRNGSKYEKIVEKIDLLKKEGIIDKLTINCTYTRMHEVFFPKDKLEHFWGELGVKYTITDVITDKPELKISLCDSKEEIHKAIDDSIQRAFYSSEFNPKMKQNKYIKAVFNALCKGEYIDVFCPDILDGVQETYHITGERIPCTSLCNYDYDSSIKKLNTKNENDVCKNCWAVNLCSKCLAEILKGNDNFPDNVELCEEKQHFEKALYCFLELYCNDINKLQRLVDLFYE